MYIADSRLPTMLKLRSWLLIEIKQTWSKHISVFSFCYPPALGSRHSIAEPEQFLFELLLYNIMSV
jgi:hypothetical protein